MADSLTTKKQAKAGSWVATITCTVRKSVVLEGCTEEEATKNPWEYAVTEHDIDQIDWNVDKVESNE